MLILYSSIDDNNGKNGYHEQQQQQHGCYVIWIPSAPPWFGTSFSSHTSSSLFPSNMPEVNPPFSDLSQYSTAGWWFQTFFIFHHTVYGIILPIA